MFYDLISVMAYDTEEAHPPPRLRVYATRSQLPAMQKGFLYASAVLRGGVCVCVIRKTSLSKIRVTIYVRYEAAYARVYKREPRLVLGFKFCMALM